MLASSAAVTAILLGVELAEQSSSLRHPIPLLSAGPEMLVVPINLIGCDAATTIIAASNQRPETSY